MGAAALIWMDNGIYRKGSGRIDFRFRAPPTQPEAGAGNIYEEDISVDAQFNKSKKKRDASLVKNLVIKIRVGASPGTEAAEGGGATETGEIPPLRGGRRQGEQGQGLAPRREEKKGRLQRLVFLPFPPKCSQLTCPSKTDKERRDAKKKNKKKNKKKKAPTRRRRAPILHALLVKNTRVGVIPKREEKAERHDLFTQAVTVTARVPASPSASQSVRHSSSLLPYSHSIGITANIVEDETKSHLHDNESHSAWRLGLLHAVEGDATLILLQDNETPALGCREKVYCTLTLKPRRSPHVGPVGHNNSPASQPTRKSGGTRHEQVQSLENGSQGTGRSFRNFNSNVNSLTRKADDDVVTASHLQMQV
ncbi:hypothetical protein FOCC_FOCC003932 [Frankliniella occidentalis]|nr:hypothetical protein FOCC_FOCC003932 [Frankliniella occidentalis]